MPEIVMPRLSDAMEEGTILRWLRSDGDEVAVGDELAEIETDKATITYEAEVAGPLTIVAAEGTSAAPGVLIAYVGEVPVDQEAPAIPAATVASTAATTATEGSPVGSRIAASPVARRLAAQSSIALTDLTGSGPGGRIIKADVQRALNGHASGSDVAEVASEQPVVSQTSSLRGEVEVHELSRVQAVVAKRMAQSRASVPDFTLRVAVDMEAAVSLRAELRALPDMAVTPSYNDLIVRAVAVALREHPRVNGAYVDGHFEHYSRVNVGIAVAAEGSLLVPTVFDADRKSLTQIAGETRALAERARNGEIAPHELDGGTVSVSNLGMFGIDSFDAVINMPQTAILAVGALSQRPVVRDGEVVVRHVADLSLSCDHRIVYGADAATFLARVRTLLETPMLAIV